MACSYRALIYIALVLPSCFADMGYGGVGVLSGAGSSSRTNSLGSQSRSNSGAYNSGNTVNARFAAAPVYSVDNSMGDNSDNADNSGAFQNIGVQSSNGAGAFSGASSSSSTGNQAGFVSGSRVGGAGSNVAAFGIGNNGGGGGFVGQGDKVQVVQVDSSSLQDIGSQIQSTIQGILQKFGITMQQSFAGANRGMYQPGQTFVIRSNGLPSSSQFAGDASQTQTQYQSQSLPVQQQQINIPGSGSFGQTQVSFFASQPIVVSYKLIGTPGRSNAGLAFSVLSGLDQGSQAEAGSSVSASNSNSRSGYTGGVRGQQSLTGAYDNSRSSNYAAAPQQAAASNYDGSQDGDDSSSDSGPSGYVAPVPVTPIVRASVYATTAAPVQQQRQKVRYVAQNNKKTESTSNVAYEQDSS